YSEAEFEEIVKVHISKKGTLFKIDLPKQPKGVCLILKWCIPEKEATIKFKQVDLNMEEKVREGPTLEEIPQQKHIWCIPRSLSTNFDMNSELELIQSPNYTSRAFWVAEDHRSIGRFKPNGTQAQGQENEELAEEPKCFTNRPKARPGDESRFGKGWTSSISQLQKSPKTNSKDLRERKKVLRIAKKGERKG
ncbi:hypothetical protein O181_125527, partial [Austropuccinia psidii MF-1]|nr:hypothetical protein [Austropuccinia psidii MF-1]